MTIAVATVYGIVKQHGGSIEVESATSWSPTATQPFTVEVLAASVRETLDQPATT